MREISTKFLEVGEHIVVDGVEYVAEEDDGDCKDCDLSNCRRCFLIPCHIGVRLKRVEVPTNGGWHTGTPTEEGEYLVQHLSDAEYCGSKFFVAKWDGEKFIINPRPPIVVTYPNGTAWQKIEPYKEKEDGKVSD